MTEVREKRMVGFRRQIIGMYILYIYNFIRVANDTQILSGFKTRSINKIFKVKLNQTYVIKLFSGYFPSKKNFTRKSISLQNFFKDITG